MRMITLLLAGLLTMTAGAQTKNTEKRAVLMVHYGTNNDLSRQKTIDVINEKVRKALPERVVMEAYSSKMVIASLKKRGIKKNSIREALRALYAKGCTDITIQSTHLLPGVMQDLIEKECDKVRFIFDTIRVKQPLLWCADDCLQLADVLVRHINAKKNEQVVLVGHGTPGPANAMYTMLDYALQDKGHTNYHVATIESYPDMECMLRLLKQKKAKRVVLSPLLYIAGNHSAEDIQGDWREALEKEGYQVTVLTEGLGEMTEVQEWIVSRLRIED
ncbi:MAG: sirohydrochlorin cobaltochelatase [Prevotella sp.]|nr:sirohydrochlorin cobaltochelatase [Prevotella sp.]